jgi:Ino eighty subunit 2
MRRSEMARRRKNLSEKRNEEEKVNILVLFVKTCFSNTAQMDTINRLLKKQAPKRRKRAEIEADQMAERIANGEDDAPRAPSAFVRSIQNSEGSVIAIPDEWIGAPFAPFLTEVIPADPARPYSGRLVEEVA